jgi:Protein of unknown function (DUF3124)
MKPSWVMVGLALVLCGALVWRGDQWGQQSGSALAQAPADHPAAFSGSLMDQRASWPVSIRQVAYVPAYSSIRLGSGKGKLDLATTLSIHNTSTETALVVLRADYFDTSGNLIYRYVPEPIAVRPLGTVEAFVSAEDTRGGSGANFIVEWGG